MKKYQKPKIITYGKDEILKASADGDCSWLAPDYYSCGFCHAQCTNQYVSTFDASNPHWNP